MAESTELVCPSCQRRYRVPGDLGGKHVKCRGCGKVFAVPASPGAGAADGPSDLPDLSSLAAEPDFESTSGIFNPTWRPNFKHKFPWAASLDFWLPIALIAAGVLWTIIQTAIDPYTGLPWVWMTRLLLVYLLYFFIVVPLGLAGLQFAASKLLFELPPRPRWRMVAVCILPVMLGYVLWLVNGGGGGFLAGLFAGLLLTSLAFWFLFRPQGEEIAPSFGAMAGGMLGGVLLSFLIMVMINFMINTMMNSYHAADQFAISPMGPGFGWNQAAAPGQPPPAAAVAANANANPNPNPAPVAPPVTQPATQPAPAAEVEPPSPPATEAGAAPGSPFVAALVEKHLPFIKDVRDDGEVGSFDAMIAPVGYSHWLATVDSKSGASADVVQCWDVRTWTAGPSATFPHTPGASAYALSPDGRFIARPVAFPRAACQVWSIADSRVVCRIDPKFADPPELIGFSDPRTIVTQSRRQDDEVFELRSVPDGILLRSSLLPKHSHSPGNCQLSSDGKWLAIAARVDGQVQVLLYDLRVPGKPLTLPIRAFDPNVEVEAAGIAFAPDLSRVTALFEQQGEAACFTWSLPDGAAQPDRTLPGAWPNLASTAATGARVFDFLGPDHWLVDGRGMIAIRSGRLIATLAPQSSPQWFSDEQTVQLLHRDPGANTGRIATIKFDLGKIREFAAAP